MPCGPTVKLVNIVTTTNGAVAARKAGHAEHRIHIGAKAVIEVFTRSLGGGAIPQKPK